jgi:hypothetical protein
MKTHVLRGSKQEIADRLVRIGGEVCEAIVFEEELTLARPDPAACEPENIFAEMAPFMIDVQNVDDSREAIYTRMEGE